MDQGLLLLAALFVKHFVIDFPLQTPYQWMNKGNYGHPGGLLHSLLHGVGTYLCLMVYAPIAAVYLALMDTFIHYHIDWAKVKINSTYGWKPDTDPQFWTLLGADQLLHALTYIVIVSMIV